jgi:hypothetical protein
LSSSNFLKFENVPYFVTGRSVSLTEFAETLGVSEELGKMFLIDNVHLVEVSFDPTAKYSPMHQLSRFLMSASDGGVFHIEFRTKFIRLSQQALAFLNTPHDLLLLSGVNM